MVHTAKKGVNQVRVTICSPRDQFLYEHFIHNSSTGIFTLLPHLE